MVASYMTPAEYGGDNIVLAACIERLAHVTCTLVCQFDGLSQARGILSGQRKLQYRASLFARQ